MYKAHSISVVIPLYNSEESIQNTLLSIKNQTLLPDEIIIINDGSTDGSMMLVNQFIYKNPNLHIAVYNKTNGGVSSARNYGLKLAKCNWIALLDSDDEWYPEKLKTQIEILKNNPKIDFLSTNRVNYKVNRIFFKKIHFLTKINHRDLLLKFIFQPSTVIFKREIITDIGYFDEDRKYAEEGIYFMKICTKYNCYFINKVLVLNGGGKAHYGEKGLSANLVEMQKGELKNIKDLYNLKFINLVEFCFYTLFSLSKFIRRFLIVKLK